MNLTKKSCLILAACIVLAGCEPTSDPKLIKPFAEKLERSLDVAVRASCKDGWTREILLRSLLLQQVDATSDCDVSLRCEGMSMVGPGNSIPYVTFTAQITPKNNPAGLRKAAIGITLQFDEAVPLVSGCKVATTLNELEPAKIDITKLAKPVYNSPK